MARDAKIVIRVPDEIKAEFAVVAESMGMTSSSLGAYVIGKYLSDERYKRGLNDKMLEMVTPQIVDKASSIDLDNPEMLQILSKTFQALSNQQKTVR